MATKEQLKTYGMITLSAVLLVSLGLNAMPEPSHYCQERQLKAYCFSLSSTLKTCYTLPNRVGGKVCDTPWQVIPQEPITPPEAPKCPVCSSGTVNVIAYTEDGKWFCDGIGIDAKCVRDENLQMPFG